MTPQDRGTDPAEPSRGREHLTDLLVERLLLARDVAASKFLTDAPVDDPAREEQVLEDVRELAATVGLDPDDIAAFFRDQFAASKLVQEELFARWTADPAQAPTTRPDLDGVRHQLDQLTGRLLRALRTAGRAAGPAHDRPAQFAGTEEPWPGRLDAVFRHAMEEATRSV